MSDLKTLQEQRKETYNKPVRFWMLNALIDEQLGVSPIKSLSNALQLLLLNQGIKETSDRGVALIVLQSAKDFIQEINRLEEEFNIILFDNIDYERGILAGFDLLMNDEYLLLDYKPIIKQCQFIIDACKAAIIEKHNTGELSCII